MVNIFHSLMTGVKKEKIWTNPSPNSALSATTFNFDISNYDYFEIRSKSFKDGADYYQNHIIKKSTEIQTVAAYADETNRSALNARGYNTNEDGTRLICDGGYRGSSSGLNANTGAMIPQEIYGIKGKIIGGGHKPLIKIFRSLFSKERGDR